MSIASTLHRRLPAAIYKADSQPASSMEGVVQAWTGLKEAVTIKGTGIPLPSTRTYGIMQWTIVPLLRFFLHIRPNGINRIPRSGPAIFAANHLSHVDPVVIVSTLRRKLHYLAKDEHFSTPGVAFVVRATGQIKTERESGAADALARASDILAARRCLGIFPEGTRSKNPEAPFLQKGKTGVARLAAAYPNMPVVPLALVGSREVMAPKIHRLPRFWRRIDVNIGHVLSWNDWLIKKGISVEQVDELRKMDAEKRKQALAVLFRSFTDDLMIKIKELGAP